MKQYLLAILLAVLFVACNADNPVNTIAGNNSSNNTSSSIFTWDSLSIKTTDTGYVSLIKAISFRTKYPSIRVEFDAETNIADNEGMKDVYVAAEYKYSNFYSYYAQDFNVINGHHTLIINTNQSTSFFYNVNFILNIVLNRHSGMGFVNMTNIQIFVN